MSDLGGRELLSEWRKAMDSALASAASLGGGAVPRQLLERRARGSGARQPRARRSARAE